ncbi:MAG: hypothetical protein IKU93_07970, partial [Alistipes sp.]|nr:hypothetical protein [Alistipes sp.]
TNIFLRNLIGFATAKVVYFFYSANFSAKIISSNPILISYTTLSIAPATLFNTPQNGVLSR